jgi:hypothetical protein
MHTIRTVTPLSSREGDLFGVPTRNRKRHMKVANAGSTDGEVAWFKLEKIDLNGDLIDIALPWRPSIAIGKTTTARLPKTAQDAAKRARRGDQRNRLRAAVIGHQPLRTRNVVSEQGPSMTPSPCIRYPGGANQPGARIDGRRSQAQIC